MAPVVTFLSHCQVLKGERYDGLALRCYKECQGRVDHPMHMTAGPKIAKAVGVRDT